MGSRSGEPSVGIIKSFLTGNPAENGSNTSREKMLMQKDLWTQYVCEVCGNKVLRGAHEWEQHLQGRHYRKEFLGLRSLEACASRKASSRFAYNLLGWRGVWEELLVLVSQGTHAYPNVKIATTDNPQGPIYWWVLSGIQCGPMQPFWANGLQELVDFCTTNSELHVNLHGDVQSVGKEDYEAYVSHPKDVEFSALFVTVIDKAVVLNFPAVTVKAPS
ncbi:hypothetical protein HAX54_041256 [Datura stramonium]|uniref:C2H2-type domain-containing protein n=1 Tax=Datura stramonium TaxID=4076 RepID=A0ABS8VS94_DATST|nr:hypothetical protein [Datura stramonium]